MSENLYKGCLAKDMKVLLINSISSGAYNRGQRHHVFGRKTSSRTTELSRKPHGFVELAPRRPENIAHGGRRVSRGQRGGTLGPDLTGSEAGERGGGARTNSTLAL